MSNWPYPRIVAHRGGGKLAPENTLAAIEDVYKRQVVNHPQGGEAHKVRVIIVGERESMPGIQTAMVSVATFVRFA